MNPKKAWLIGVVLIISLLVFTGCSNESEEMSDMEIFEKAFMQNIERHSYEVSGEMALTMDNLSMDNPGMGSMFGMLNNISANFEGKMNGEDLENPEAHMAGQINAGGFGVALEMYMLEEQIAIKAPMMAQFLGDQRLVDGYLLIDPEEDLYGQEGYEDVDPQDQEEIYQLMQKFSEIYMEIVEEEFITNKGETEITINDEALDVQEFEIYMGKEEIETILNSIPEVVEDEEFRELIYEVAQMTDPEISEEEITEELDRFSEELDQEKIDEMMSELEEVLDMEESAFVMTLYIDDEYRIVRENYDLNLVVIEDQESVTVQMEGTMEYWNINGDVEIDAPEFTEENSVRMQELMFAPGF